jgi:hypothetical protein
MRIDEGMVWGSINRGLIIHFDNDVTRDALCSQDIRSGELDGLS